MEETQFWRFGTVSWSTRTYYMWYIYGVKNFRILFYSEEILSLGKYTSDEITMNSSILIQLEEMVIESQFKSWNNGSNFSFRN